MDSQWAALVSAWSKGGGVYVQSFHFTFPPESAIVQITLSSRADNGDVASGFVLASAYFTGYKTADGLDHGLDTNPPIFIDNQITEFSGYLAVGSCSAQAIINVFGWPSVTSS